MENYATSKTDLIKNPAPRCACVLLLDTSESMRGAPIDQLNAGLKVLLDEISSHEKALESVEIAIVAFGAKVTPVVSFTSADKVTVPLLVAAGPTPMVEAVKVGQMLLAERLNEYENAGIARLRPLVILMTDGQPTDAQGMPTDDYKATASLLRAASLRPHKDGAGIRVCCVAIGENARVDILSEFCSPAEPPIRIDPNEFRKLFRWFSVYLADIVHSQDAEKLRTDDW